MTRPPFVRRRSFLALTAVAVLGGSAATLLGSSLPADAQANAGASRLGPVRIGFQKSGTVQISLKTKQTLEKLFKARGGSVEWLEFPAGLPMVEALNAGAIDIAYVGEAPPIFAQAANGSTARYVAYDPYGPQAEGILVQKDSKIRRLADLRGKRIGVQKGSSAHYLTIKALQSAGLSLKDVEPVYLAPADARSAFNQGSIDAWVIWDPFNAATTAQNDVRVLRTSEGLVTNRDFYLATRSFARENPDVIKELRKQTQVVSRWANRNDDQVVAFFSPLLRIDASVLNVVTRRRDFSFVPFTPKVVQEQQEIADQFFRLKLIPRAIKVSDAVDRQFLR